MTIDPLALAQIPRDKPVVMRLGPVRPVTCAISGCPIDEHSYAGKVRWQGRTYWLCNTCADDNGFTMDWSKV
jgi:hypothetical protein